MSRNNSRGQSFRRRFCGGSLRNYGRCPINFTVFLRWRATGRKYPTQNAWGLAMEVFQSRLRIGKTDLSSAVLQTFCQSADYQIRDWS